MRKTMGFTMDDTLSRSVEKLHETFDRTDLEVEWKKIQQKFEEAKYNPGDVKPLADCIFSILLAARNRGYSTEAVFKELDRVAKDNLSRRWKKMPDGTYQAI
jgi:hypothetical protein